MRRKIIVVRVRGRYRLLAVLAKTPSLGFPRRHLWGAAVAGHWPTPRPFPGVG